MAFIIPAPSWIDTELQLIEEPIKRSQGPVPPSLRGLRLGVPVVRAVRGDEFEPPARLQLEADGASHRYHLVQLALSVGPDDPYKRLFVEVKLAGDLGPDSAIAWSMLPTRESQPVTQTGSLEIGVDLGLVSVTAGGERTVTEERLNVTTYGPRSAEPAWEDLAEVPGRALTGAHYLALLVRSARGCNAIGQVRCTATVARGALFFRYESPTRDDARVGFTIASAGES